MPRVREPQDPCGKVQDTEPRGDEHAGIVILAKLFIGHGKDLVRLPTALRQILDDRLCPHHEHRRGDPFPGYIRDHKGDHIFA